MAYLFSSVLTLSILVSYGLDFSFRFYSHFLLSLLVHGVSGGKIYFLLFYMSTLFLLLFLRRNRKGSWPVGSGWSRRAFLFSVAMGMAASLGSYLHYLLNFSLPIAVHHYHFREVYNSVNYLPHVHTSKVFINRLADLIGLGHVLGGMDDGRVFVNSIPPAYGYVTLSSVSSVLFLSFFLIPGIVQRWRGANRTGIAFLAILAFHSLIKSLSDGGPLAYDFLVAIGVVWVLLHAQDPREVQEFLKRKWRIFFWSFLGILFLKCLIDPSLGIATYTLKHGGLLFAIYSLCYLVTLWGSLRRKWLKWVVLSGLLGLLSYTVFARYSVYIRPFLAYLEEGTTIHYFHYKDRPLPERLLGGQVRFDSDFLTIYSLSLEGKERVLEVYRTLEEDPYRNRRTAILFPNRREGQGILAELTFLEFRESQTALNVLKIFDLQLREENLDQRRFSGAIAFDPSYFPVLGQAEGAKITQLDENHKFLIYYFLNRFFYHSGVKEYILTPVGFYRFNRTP